MALFQKWGFKIGFTFSLLISDRLGGMNSFDRRGMEMSDIDFLQKLKVKKIGIKAVIYP